MVIVSTAFVYTAGAKIGFRKIMENQMQAQPKQQARLEQSCRPISASANSKPALEVYQVLSYCFPILTLLIWLIIATALFATFKFAAGADVSFKVSFAIVILFGAASDGEGRCWPCCRSSPA